MLHSKLLLNILLNFILKNKFRIFVLFSLSRNFTHNWLEALFDIVKFPFELSLSLLCQENGKLQNGDHSVSEGGALTTGSIVIDGLIADDKQKKLIAKVFYAFYQGFITVINSFV